MEYVAISSFVALGLGSLQTDSNKFNGLKHKTGCFSPLEAPF